MAPLQYMQTHRQYFLICIWRVFQSGKNADEILHRLMQVIHDLARSAGSSARDAMKPRSSGLERKDMNMPVVIVSTETIRVVSG